MPRALIDGIDIAWERAGEGEPLLFLHGSGTTMAQMSLVRRPFEAALDVLTLDHRHRRVRRAGVAVHDG
ncbi:MAG: hypothetical protein R2701_12510 [Acidimicrobiales bacterium]